MKATEKKTTRKGMIIRIAVAAFAVYILYSLITMQANISKKQDELDEIRQEYTEMLIRNEELQKTLDSYGTDEFIEEQAREKLGYAYPDEHFYIDVSGTD